MGYIPAWVISIFIIVGVLIIAGLGFLLWAWLFRRRKMYPFILYSRSGDKARIINARIKVDPENPENKKFAFPGVDTMLELREPTLFFNGKSYRQIIQNRNAGYSYIDGFKLDEEKYLKLSLSPEEKSLALARIKENQERNANPMSKMQATVLVTGFIMIVILSIGIIYSTIAYVGAGKNVVKVVETNKVNIEGMKSIATQQKGITEQLAGITGALTNNKNITRQIS